MSSITARQVLGFERLPAGPRAGRPAAQWARWCTLYVRADTGCFHTQWLHLHVLHVLAALVASHGRSAHVQGCPLATHMPGLPALKPHCSLLQIAVLLLSQSSEQQPLPAATASSHPTAVTAQGGSHH